jgi:hypothetical protein
MCTFADGGECLAARDLLPQLTSFCNKFFTFNNSALYMPKRLGNAMTEIYWKMCMDGVQNFLDFVKEQDLEPLSLTQSREVIRTRNYLKVSIRTTRQHIKICMDSLEYLHRVLEDIADNQEKINKNCSYQLPPQTITKYRWTKRDNDKPTQFCSICQVPCCQVCTWPMGHNESQCTYFHDGNNCPVCPKKCPKSAHQRWTEVDYQESYQETMQGVDIHKKDLFEEGEKDMNFAEELLAQKVQESEDVAQELLKAMQEVKELQGKLSAIALQPRMFTDMEYFDQMIQLEEDEKRPGWEERKADIETFRDEVLSLDEYSKVDDLTDLFPQYQAVIASATQERDKSESVDKKDKIQCNLM